MLDAEDKTNLQTEMGRGSDKDTSPGAEDCPPLPQARRKARIMGSKAKVQGKPQVGQHEPPGQDPQQFWCQRSSRGPIPVTQLLALGLSHKQPRAFQSAGWGLGSRRSRNAVVPEFVLLGCSRDAGSGFSR